jgi:hypothetical protein
MDTIISPISKDSLLKELTPEKFLKFTSKGGNEIYDFSFRDAPSLMYEVARLREVSFRKIGCGTGKAMDIDENDVRPVGFRQLIVWNPIENEIIGGYRYAICQNHLNNISSLSVPHYFNFSREFINNYLPYSIELGRAWVNPAYQPSAGNRKSIFALDNLWDGLGSVIKVNPQIKYLYGKITFSSGYDPIARYLLLWLLEHYFSDERNLIKPKKTVAVPNVIDVAGIRVDGNNFEKDYKSISHYIRSLRLTIPPLVNSYLGLAKTIIIYGTAKNPELGNSFETGILINIQDIYPEKLQRYTSSVSRKEVALT